MGGRKKQYLLLAGEPVLLRALRPFLRRDDVRAVAVALPPEDADDPPEWLQDADERVRVVAGGASRGESVRAALEALPEDVDIVVVHDGARPLLDDDTVERCLETAGKGIGAVAGWPAVDTVKVVGPDLRIVRTPDRSTLWMAQTPQVFPRTMLVRAYASASENELAATDDASLVEVRGGEVRMVRGSPRNIKVTRNEDLYLAEAYLRAEPDPRTRREDTGADTSQERASP